MSISFESKGSFDKTEKFLRKIVEGHLFDNLERYAVEGVAALSNATPLDTGETARSWTYEILIEKDSYSIIWNNTHVDSGRPIAILLQYGHGTGTGGYVEGIDYINPALRPIFDRIAAEVWKVVTSA